MLKISLTPGEYLTIGDNIVVQLYRSEGGRSYLAIDAPPGDSHCTGRGAGAGRRPASRASGGGPEEGTPLRVTPLGFTRLREPVGISYCAKPLM